MAKVWAFRINVVSLLSFLYLKTDNGLLNSSKSFLILSRYSPEGLWKGWKSVLFSSVPKPVFLGGEPCLPRCRTVSSPVPDFCIPYYLLLVIQPNKSKKRKNLFANSKKSRTFASRLLSQKDKRLIHSKLIFLCPGKVDKW